MLTPRGVAEDSLAFDARLLFRPHCFGEHGVPPISLSLLPYQGLCQHSVRRTTLGSDSKCTVIDSVAEFPLMTNSASRRLTADSTSTRHSEAVSFYSLTEIAMRSVAAGAGHTLSPIQSHVDDMVPRPRLLPRDRFRSAVRKVVAMHRLAANVGPVGREPGVDPRRAAVQLEYGHIKQRCTIEVTDYSSLRHTSRIMNNEEFSEFINNDRRESWAKVRWINVGGLDWSVISALALAYGAYIYAIQRLYAF